MSPINKNGLDDVSNGNNDSLKRKKNNTDSIENISKIRKLSDNHNLFTNAHDIKIFQKIEINEKVAKENELSKKKINSTTTLSQKNLILNNKCPSVNDDSGHNTENTLNSQGTDTLEGLDDFFEDEWSYKNDTLDNLDDFFKDEWCHENENIIDFNTPKRCIIIDITSDTNSITLSVKSKDASAIVKCIGVWSYVKIEIGEPVVIKAKKESVEAKYWIVDYNSGWIINQPDILLSSTSVVGALFCNRRSIFKEKFKFLESLPYYECGNNPMFIGSLSHELLQMALDKGMNEMKQISALLHEIIKSKNTIYMMYSAGISSKELKNLMQPAVVQIYKFIQQYIIGNPSEVTDNQNFDGKIEKICDIEETIWMPNLGLKGKIDLTVEVSNKSRNKLGSGIERRILPLEIKTGRVSFSNEHRGQLILYTMLMDMTDRKTDSGLLLYLKENVMREVMSSIHVRRDLITLRNTIAYYITRQPTIVKVKDKVTISPMEFPEPIDHSACTQCPYNVLCCTYLSKEDKKPLHDNHPLKDIHKEVLKYLTEKHIDYVFHWVSILQIEEDPESQNSWKNLWTIKPSKREKTGLCISNLNLISVSEIYGRFLLEFKRIENYTKASVIDKMEFNENDFVIISTDSRIYISSGFIHKITSSAVLLYCEKDINKIYKGSVFHIDKNLSSSFLGYNMSQLAGLLDNHEICSKLRKIVIEKQPATFNLKLPKSIMNVGKDIFQKLNERQKQAILKSFSTNDYLLIKGYPGTGKTETVVAIIELFLKLDKSVLVTSHTNNAVDNILLKLLERNIDFIRFGSLAKVNPALVHLFDDNVTKDCDSPESLHDTYCSKKVVGVTCYGTTHPHLSKRIFDICIVDESTQVLQPTILGPLYCASKFILIGDPEQLPPIAKNNTARKLGISESLFSRLNSENNVVDLVSQYRMNKCIMNTANKLTYQDKLQVGNDSIGNATIPITNKGELKLCKAWIKKALSLKLKDSTIFLNTSGTYNLEIDPKFPEIKGSCNYWEAAIIKQLINVLINLGIDNKTIGIITPYRAQVRLLKAVIFNDIEINTVDQYQGRAKSVIIYSCSKSISTDTEILEYDILEDHQRLTVAVTRARHKLIIIGDFNTLQRFNPFNKLFVSLREDEQIYDLKDGKDNFCFNDLIKTL